LKKSNAHQRATESELQAYDGITDSEVEKIARLSYLAVPIRTNEARHTLERIALWLTQVQEIDTTGYKPCYSPLDASISVSTRPDAVADGAISKELLANAANVNMGYFAIPTAVDVSNEDS